MLILPKACRWAGRSIRLLLRPTARQHEARPRMTGSLLKRPLRRPLEKLNLFPPFVADRVGNAHTRAPSAHPVQGASRAGSPPRLTSRFIMNRELPDNARSPAREPAFLAFPGWICVRKPYSHGSMCDNVACAVCYMLHTKRYTHYTRCTRYTHHTQYTNYAHYAHCTQHTHTHALVTRLSDSSLLGCSLLHSTLTYYRCY